MKTKYLLFSLWTLLAVAAEDPRQHPGAIDPADSSPHTDETEDGDGTLTGFEEAMPGREPGQQSQVDEFWKASNWKGGRKIAAEAASKMPIPQKEGSAKGSLYSPRPANQPLDDVFNNGIKRTPISPDAKPISIYEDEFVQLTGSAQVAYRGSILPDQPVYFLKISPRNIKDGYFLPDTHPDSTGAKKYTFLTTGDVPRESIVGAWKVRRLKDGSPELQWVSNPNYSCLDKIKDFCTKPREQWRVKSRSSCFPKLFGRAEGAQYEQCLEPLEATVGEGATDGEVGTNIKEQSKSALKKEEEFERIADEYAEKTFEGFAVKYGLDKSFDGVPLKGLFGKIRAQAKNYKPLYTKPRKGSPVKGVLAIVGVGSWINDVVAAFKRDLPVEEKAAVATSILPIVGCATRLAADGAADPASIDTAKIVDAKACVVADRLLLSPAWPLGLIIHGVRSIISSLPTLIKIQGEWSTLRTPEGLEQRYKEEWSSLRHKILNSTTIHLTKIQVNRNITISRLSDLVVAAEAGGILKVGQVKNTTNQVERQKLLEDMDFPGRQKLEKAICDKFKTRISAVRQDLEQSRQAVLSSIDTARRPFSESFKKHYTQFLIKNRPREFYNIKPRPKYFQDIRDHVSNVTDKMARQKDTDGDVLKDIGKGIIIPPSCV